MKAFTQWAKAGAMLTVYMSTAAAAADDEPARPTPLTHDEGRESAHEGEETTAPEVDVDGDEGEADPRDPECPPGAFCEPVTFGSARSDDPDDPTPVKGPVKCEMPASPSSALAPPSDHDRKEEPLTETDTVAAGPPAEGEVEHRSWGVALRGVGVPVPRGGMGGVGFSLRPRPSPFFALDLGIDALSGVDANEDERHETVLSTSGILYVNPQQASQVYTLFGVHVSWAKVVSDEPRPNLANGTSDSHAYAGAQIGMGMELRPAPTFGVGFDMVGFVRTRTDDRNAHPEFVDEHTGTVSNSSAGVMMRAGFNFWL